MLNHLTDFKNNAGEWIIEAERTDNRFLIIYFDHSKLKEFPIYCKTAFDAHKEIHKIEDTTNFKILYILDLHVDLHHQLNILENNIDE